MCPFCIGNAVLMAGSLMSTGGLVALVMRVRQKKDRKKSRQDVNPKEETWEK